MSNQSRISKKFKLTPLIGVLLLVSVAAVGATAYYLMLQFTVTSSFTTKGIAAQSIQAGNHGNYLSKPAATTLAAQKYGPSDGQVFADNSVSVVALSNNLTNEDLRLVVEVLDHATGTPMDTSQWVASPEYCAYYWTAGDGMISNGFGNPTALTSNSTHASWTIANADISKMTWMDISVPADHHTAVSNDLLIPISFGSAYTPSGFGDHNVDVKVWLQVIVP